MGLKSRKTTLNPEHSSLPSFSCNLPTLHTKRRFSQKGLCKKLFPWPQLQKTVSKINILINRPDSNTFINNARLKLAKIKQILSNTLTLNFCYLKITHILHPRYSVKIIGRILKNKRKNKSVCIHEIIQFVIMKIKKKRKNRSRRYGQNRIRSRRHGHK